MVSNVDLVEQAPYTYLCWAACATMVLRHLKRSVNLSDVVTATYGQFVDQTAWPQYVYMTVYNLNCLYLTRAQLLAEGSTVGSVWIGQWLSADWPLQPYIRWNDGAGYHTIILGGVYPDGRVRVLDPATGEDSVHTFEDIMQGYQQGTLEGLWYDVGFAKSSLAFSEGPSDQKGGADD
jgi:hypothetical protein